LLLHRAKLTDLLVDAYQFLAELLKAVNAIKKENSPTTTFKSHTLPDVPASTGCQALTGYKMI
jgi:hypothetical protein